ncbi:MAG: hypothetical protein AAF337_00115 [Pseudomonadota bacterium]
MSALSESANVTLSCEHVGVSRTAIYAAKRDDADFAAQWSQAMQLALDALEAELIRRAIEGTQSTQFYQGKPIGVVTSYSDSLAMFLLKSHRPEVYGSLKTAMADVACPEADQAKRDDAYQRLVDALERIEKRRAKGETPQS